MLIIFYNVVLVTYAILLIRTIELKGLVLFLEIVGFLHFCIMTNFTLRYYQLSRAMRIYFTSDYQKQLELLQPKSMRYNRTVVTVTIAILYLLASSSSVVRLTGDICLIKYTAQVPVDPKEIDRCQKFIRVGYCEEIIMWSIVFAVQYYSMTMIFLVARQNQQRVRKTAFT